MYKHGFDLPHFALFPLLDNPKAVHTLKRMFRSYLNIVAAHGANALMGGLDYRASPSWGDQLGYSAAGLSEQTERSIDFLKELAFEYRFDVRKIVIQGLVGPKGDAYDSKSLISIEEAEDYHSVQLTTLKNTDVEMAQAMTFNNVNEAIGVARAADIIGLPLAISLTLDRNAKLYCGTSLKDAIIEIDKQSNHSVLFYSVNCSHPLEFKPAIFNEDWIYRVRGARPNASNKDKMELCNIGHLEAGNPLELGELCGDLTQRFPHMDIWGGCCGTWDSHLDEIAKNVLSNRRLSLKQIA
jgi:S-methylmethionine-dependent homocysteine/selenocysteine methylase